MDKSNIRPFAFCMVISGIGIFMLICIAVSNNKDTLLYKGNGKIIIDTTINTQHIINNSKHTVINDTVYSYTLIKK
jgi:hypothetical protein